MAFDTITCSRCQGKGRGDWAPQYGVCFKCQGKGVVLTAKGRAQREADIAAHTATVALGQLQPGDVVVTRDGDKVRRAVVVAVTPTAYPEALRARRADAPDVFITYAAGGEGYGKFDDTVTVWLEA